MRKDKVLKISCVILFITLIMFSFTSNTINAAINQTYTEATTRTNTGDANIESKVKSTVVLDALASFVYAVASIIENLVGNIFYTLTGATDFPWADKIIFNAIPLLDINFFNASEGSFFKSSGGEDTVLAKVVRNTYFSVLAIVVAFLTIVVAIAATRMALSTLATEKAKYKEAVTKWLFSITLIFLMHNLMSFIFFVNEGLVEVASSILVKNMEGVGEDLQKKLTASGEDAEQIVKNFIEQNSSIFGSDGGDEILADPEKMEIAGEVLQVPEYRDYIMKYASEDGWWDHFVNFISLPSVWSGGAVHQLPHNAVLLVTVELVQNKDELDKWVNYWAQYDGLSKDEKRVKFEEDYDMNTLTQWLTTTDQINEWIKFFSTITTTARDVRKAMYTSDGTFIGRNATDNKFDIVGNMAKYFKYNAWNFKRDESGKLTGWKASKISVTGAILYAIFLAQSILYFFSYVKRFFYIVILAILAPVIVLFDFLGKAVS